MPIYKRYSPVTSINKREVLKIYKGSITKNSRELQLDEKELSLIIKTLFKTISKEVYNSIGGVLLKGIGYIGIWMSPNKIVKKGLLPDKSRLATNYHTGSKMYHPTLVTDVYHNNVFKGWSLDRAFGDDVRTEISKKLKAGVKYKFYYTKLKRMFNSLERKRNNEV